MNASFDMNEDNKRVTVYFHNVNKEEISRRFPEAEWDRMNEHNCFSAQAMMGNIEMVFFSKMEE